MSQHSLAFGGKADERQEMQQLKAAVQRLLADNEQKSLEINSLRSQLLMGERAGSRAGQLLENGCSGPGSQRSSSLSGHSPQPGGGGSGGSAAPTPPAHQQNPIQPLQPLPSQPAPLDINHQLRKLLFDDVKENMAHSSSFPASLSASLHSPQHQPTSGAGAAGPAGAPFIHRSPLPPSASYLSSLSAGGQPHQQQVAWQPVGAPGAAGAPRPLHHTTSLFAQPSNSTGLQ